MECCSYAQWPKIVVQSFRSKIARAKFFFCLTTNPFIICVTLERSPNIDEGTKSGSDMEEREKEKECVCVGVSQRPREREKEREIMRETESNGVRQQDIKYQHVAVNPMSRNYLSKITN